MVFSVIKKVAVVSLSAVIFGGVSQAYAAHNFYDYVGSAISATNDSLFIGASGTNYDGSTSAGVVYKCDLDGANCIPNRGFVRPTGGDHFGASLYATDKKLLIGAPESDDGGPSGGVVYQCELSGANCSTLRESISGGNAGFGSSIYVTDTNLFIGASNEANGRGVVYKCNLDGANCVGIQSGVEPNERDNFGSSLYATATHLFIGATGTNNSEGAVYQCNLDGTNCAPIQLDVLDKIGQFGSSLYASDKNLFIGASGINSYEYKVAGAVYKCNLDGANCSRIRPGVKLNEEDGFGSSIHATDKNLFIGAMDTNNEAGVVYKCSLEGTNCIPLSL